MKRANTRLTELEKAKNAGYANEFILTPGGITDLLYPECRYAYCQVVDATHYCAIDNHTVYLITTPCGRKGTAISINRDTPPAQ